MRDALERSKRKRHPAAADGGFGPVVKEFAYTYNDNNLPINVTELRVDNSTVQYLMAYDGLDRLRSETDGFGKTTQFSYLDNGLRASMIDPLGATVGYQYDELNRLKQVSSPYGGATYQYHSDDLLQKMSFPDATSPKVTCDYGYDNAGRVTSVTNRNAPANSVISSYGLAYNDATNQITLNEQNLIGGNPAKETSVFSFSQGNRLTTADYQTRGYQVSYTYNSAGYRTTETATGTTAYSRNYSYGQLGRLSSVAQTGGGNAGTTSFGWDANGNLTTKTFTPESGAPQTTTFTYDIRDNLRKVVSPNGQTAGLYQYDHAARRVRQETAAGVLHSTFDGDQILAEWNGTMQNVAAYVSGRGQLVARSEAGPTRTNYAMVMNHLGSTANVVNVTAAPTVSASYRYDAWGVLRQETPISQNNNRQTFTGQRFDDETGLYMMGAGNRFLDPELGMLTQMDPIDGDIASPMTLNPYTYAWSNPLWFIDPLGLYPQDPNGKPEYKHGDKIGDKTLDIGIDWLPDEKGEPGADDGGATTGSSGNRKPKSGKSETSEKDDETIELSNEPVDKQLNRPGVKKEPVTATTQVKPASPKESINTQPGNGQPGINPANDDSVGSTVGSFVENILGGFRDRGVGIIEGIGGILSDPRTARAAADQSFLNHVIPFGLYGQYQNITTYAPMYWDYLNNADQVNGYVFDVVNQAGLANYFGAVGHELGGLFFDAVTAEVTGAPFKGGGAPTTIFPNGVPTAPRSISTGPRSHPLKVLNPDECFVAGTWILMAGGVGTIEEIKKDDYVLSQDERTGEVAYKRVTATFKRWAEEILDVLVVGEEQPIGATPTHPFQVRRGDEQGWVAAGDLEAGDVVQRPSGEWATVMSIAKRDGGAWVYNFEVEDFHTYFVGRLGTWVHNQCPIRFTHGPNGEIHSAFAKIEPTHIGTGTPTNASSRDFARRLGNPTDDAGHAIGKNLGGPGGSTSGNIFPQSPNINRGAFRQFEQGIAQEVLAGNDVHVRVIPKYHPGSTRPYELVYQVRVNGQTTTRIFPNP